MKIKPLIKGGKPYLTSWIMNHFPKNYEEMNYIEPFIGGGVVLLNKNNCKEDTINDSDLNKIQIWRVLRDEGKSFLSKLKKTEYKEKTFKFYQNKNTKNYFEEAVKEFVLRKMSINELKKNYCPPKTSKKWKEIIEDLEKMLTKVSKKLNIFNKNPNEIIKFFNSNDSLIYCNPPDLKMSVDKSNEMTTDQHISLAEALNASEGKIIVTNKNNSLYRKLYSSWKMHKHTSKKIECMWINF